MIKSYRSRQAVEETLDLLDFFLFFELDQLILLLNKLVDSAMPIIIASLSVAVMFFHCAVLNESGREIVNFQGQPRRIYLLHQTIYTTSHG